MKIVADQNIPFVEPFSRLGTVVRMPAAEITAASVKAAELLLVRSTVKVNRALLEGSQVRFVATATIGIDHLDVKWLDENGIAWASAPGSNADSVALWWTAALATLADRGEIDLSQLTVGIVGVGEVGRRIERVARSLGAQVLLCDPPRARREAGAPFIEIDELLAQSSVVTFHVPLERKGQDATFHLLNQERLRLLAAGALVINASRGEVVDGEALLQAISPGPLRAMLDVYEHEPTPDPRLVAACRLATPHIAGHSIDGKANGTRMIYEAACRFSGVAPAWPTPALPPRPEPIVADGLLAALRAVYRVEQDDTALRQIVASPPADRAQAFRRYRENYPLHRELMGATVRLVPPRQQVASTLAALGAIA